MSNAVATVCSLRVNRLDPHAMVMQCCRRIIFTTDRVNQNETFPDVMLVIRGEAALQRLHTSPYTLPYSHRVQCRGLFREADGWNMCNM